MIIEGIFISKTVTSLQLKVHECYVKPLKPRESLLTNEEAIPDNTKKATKFGLAVFTEKLCLFNLNFIDETGEKVFCLQMQIMSFVT